MTLRERLRKGVVIPAHPLALDARRKLDERRQRALTRYYLAAGVGGVAVGVHTTQFAIRNPAVGLLNPVLSLAIEELNKSNIIKISGVCGATRQALQEAELTRSLGYDAALLSMASFAEASIEEMLDHAKLVAEIIPIIGFYLQPKVGGRTLPYEFWLRLAQVENLVAIKIAPLIDIKRSTSSERSPIPGAPRS